MQTTNQVTELKLRVGISGQECGVFKLDPNCHGRKLGGKAYLYECCVLDTSFFSDDSEEFAEEKAKLIAEGFVFDEFGYSNDTDEMTYYVAHNPNVLIECEHHFGNLGYATKSFDEAVKDGLQIDYFADAELQTFLHDKLGDTYQGVVELVEFLGNEKTRDWGYKSREQ